MNRSEAFLRLAFLGMKRDPEEIIDYMVIWFSVLISLILGMAIWTRNIGGMWVWREGPMAILGKLRSGKESEVSPGV